MPVSDLCAKQLVSIQPESTLQDAAKLMKEHHIGAIVVCESGSKKPMGLITDRDIVLCALADGQDLSAPVSEFMSDNVVEVHQSEGIAEMVDKMEQEGVRRIVVTDDEGRACGIVSSDDVLQLVAREMNGLGRIAQRQSENRTTLQ